MIERRLSGAASAVAAYLVSSREAITAAIEDPEFTRTVSAIADRLCLAFAAGNKVMLAGNGGSAADVQHIAGELLGRFNYDRAPLPAVALTTDSSVMTAIANDYGYAELFERQVRGLGRPGDVLIALSTSGRSPNILRALAAARDAGVAAIGLTGSDDRGMAAHCDICLRAPAAATPLIQQLHLMAGHIICGLVEERLFPRPASPDPTAE